MNPVLSTFWGVYVVEYDFPPFSLSLILVIQWRIKPVGKLEVVWITALSTVAKLLHHTLMLLSSLSYWNLIDTRWHVSCIGPVSSDDAMSSDAGQLSCRCGKFPPLRVRVDLNDELGFIYDFWDFCCGAWPSSGFFDSHPPYVMKIAM